MNVSFSGLFCCIRRGDTQQRCDSVIRGYVPRWKAFRHNLRENGVRHSVSIAFRHSAARSIHTANRRVLGDIFLCVRTGDELKGVPGRVFAYDLQRT